MNAKKTLCLGVMMASAGWSGLAAAATATAHGSICDTAAKAETMYSCSSGSYNAVHIFNGTCNAWNHRGMLAGAYYYKYYGGCPNTCEDGSSCNAGRGNHYIVTGSNGWEFRQFFVIATASSYSKTCDRCTLGLIGGNSSSGSKPMMIASNTQYGTKTSAWYTGVILPCDSGYCGNIIGYPTL